MGQETQSLDQALPLVPCCRVRSESAGLSFEGYSHHATYQAFLELQRRKYFGGAWTAWTTVEKIYLSGAGRYVPEGDSGTLTSALDNFEYRIRLFSSDLGLAQGGRIVNL